MGAAFTFREYQASDFEAMFRLDEVCFEPRFRFSREMMRELAEAEGALALLAELDGRLAGFCIVEVQEVRGEKAGYLATIDVATEFRREGLATALLNRVEEQARSAGCSTMRLHVFTGNAAAVRFYEKQGYGFVREARNFYGHGVHGVVYQKPLKRFGGTDAWAR